ncbi:coiled-coil domain-containing protein 81 [Phaenicophaeus curvirostris]|uniref:coiled-coil domain-containing protein 81 n=1 Tax=Phaenicophaeus curvirostris TaxID=33595 RepID=UPI0037F0F7A4
MDFWDGLEHQFIMPSITGEDTEHYLVFLCFPERTTIWDVVAGYIEERLLLHKGIRIPALGTFDTVPEWIQVGDEAVTVQRPVFRLARNLVIAHNLTDNKDYLPGHKELKPLKYSKVATAASVSRLKAENCIQGTLSFLSACLGKGKNIALVLRDIGVLLIEGTNVQMKFFCNFLERLSGKENWDKAVAKVPQLLDMVVSSDVPLASLTVSGHVIAFPEFAQQWAPKPPARDRLKHWRGVPGAFAELPSAAAASLSHIEIPGFRQMKNTMMQKKSLVRRQPAIPQDSAGKNSAGKKLVVTSQPKERTSRDLQANLTLRAHPIGLLKDMPN